MPLPTALAAKLAKRGLITSKPKLDIPKNASTQKGYEGCPNKYNIQHECTKYCMTRWKVGVLEPATKYLTKRERHLKKFPLPLNWKEIYDRGCGQFYYWDTKNDVVSWLSPKHPKAKISYSAAYLREERLFVAASEKVDKPEEKKKYSEGKEGKRHNNHKSKNHKATVSNMDMHLDPMDPAAYSDIPRGTWSTGLQTNADPKTGVDPTASGPLYQMRPYPSPGAVLAKNKHSKKK